jgi:hypothetical protein
MPRQAGPHVLVSGTVGIDPGTGSLAGGPSKIRHGRHWRIARPSSKPAAPVWIVPVWTRRGRAGAVPGRQRSGWKQANPNTMTATVTYTDGRTLPASTGPTTAAGNVSASVSYIRGRSAACSYEFEAADVGVGGRGAGSGSSGGGGRWAGGERERLGQMMRFG